jgi:hypothetical protein
MIAYIDECKAKRYVLALHLVDPKDQARLRRFLTENLLSGQRSIHFRKESPRRRKQLIKSFLNEKLEVVIFNETSMSSSPSRSIVIRALSSQIRNLGLTELVFELDETTLSHDSKLLSDLHIGLHWDHRQRHQEPLLWVADAVAWCMNRGGEWERMVRPMIVETISC